MDKIPWVLALLAWAFLAAWAFEDILPKVLKVAKTPAQRLVAHVLCAILSVLIGLLLPFRWIFPHKGDE